LAVGPWGAEEGAQVGNGKLATEVIVPGLETASPLGRGAEDGVKAERGCSDKGVGVGGKCAGAAVLNGVLDVSGRC
jgi:hypothetical protein